MDLTLQLHFVIYQQVKQTNSNKNPNKTIKLKTSTTTTEKKPVKICLNKTFCTWVLTFQTLVPKCNPDQCKETVGSISKTNPMQLFHSVWVWGSKTVHNSNFLYFMEYCKRAVFERLHMCKDNFCI